jgi:rhamnosyl/mannosyltransferase
VKAISVLHFGKFYPPHKGGMEVVLATLCRGLARRGLDCTAVVTGQNGEPCHATDRGVRVRRMRSLGTLRSLPVCPAAPGALRDIRADVVNLHHPNPLADLACLLSNSQARFVVTYHADIVRQHRLARLHAPLLRRTLERADVIVATSADYVASSAPLRRFRRKVRVIPLGLDLQPPGRLRPPFSRTGAEPQYLFIGRLVPYKGVPVLLEALRMVPGRLWLIGAGPEEARLRHLADARGLRGRIEFLGEVSQAEKAHRLAACDALVLPSVSRAEAFGLVILEAMAMERPVVASDLPAGVRELVTDKVTGYRFAPGDAPALARALRRLASEPAEARHMGREARGRYLQNWTADRMVSSYVRLYEDLCGRVRAAARPKRARQRDGARRA